jgi:hypothetical protein
VIWERIRRAAVALSVLLARLPAVDLEGYVAELGLAEARGPHRLPLPPPRAGAVRLAKTFAEQSIQPLSQAFESRWAGVTFRGGWKGHAPEQLLDGAAGLGLALLGACSEESLAAAACTIVAVEAYRGNEDPFVKVRSQLRTARTQFLLIETSLWDLAARHGGPAPFMPYALRFAAIEWWWAPEAHRAQTAVSLCLRCGSIYVPGRLPRSALPLCSNCRRTGEKDLRQWPAHAIAPAERSTWWLRCAASGCTNLFLAHRQARRCPHCRLELITPTRRHPPPV